MKTSDLSTSLTYANMDKKDQFEMQENEKKDTETVIKIKKL